MAMANMLLLRESAEAVADTGINEGGGGGGGG